MAGARLIRRAGELAALGAVVVSCGLLPPDYTIHASNSTTRAMTVVVNGTDVVTIEPNSMADISPGRLPARPWEVNARLAGGRFVAAMTVEDGAIQDHRAIDGTGSYSSVGARATLSCGQVWIWVGEPGSGGGAAEGTPGDCDP